MQIEDQDAVAFLSGENSVRDGNLTGLSIRTGKNGWDTIVNITFHVPNGAEGEDYDLELGDSVSFDYGFTSENTPQEIAFVKCLWTDDGYFYLSLDPWKESERFISEQDNDCFKSKSAKLTVSRSRP